MLYLLATAIGIVAGLRTMIPLAALCWAAYLGWLDFSAAPYAFVGHSATAIVVTLLAIGELIADQLPNTPSRKVPMQFGARIFVGVVAAGLLTGDWMIGGVLGAIGAVIGTLAGAELRVRLARAFGRDLPAALLEDTLAVLGAILIVYLA